MDEAKFRDLLRRLNEYYQRKLDRDGDIIHARLVRGKSFELIAREMCFSSPLAAERAFKRAMARADEVEKPRRVAR